MFRYWRLLIRHAASALRVYSTAMPPPCRYAAPYMLLLLILPARAYSAIIFLRRHAMFTLRCCRRHY